LKNNSELNKAFKLLSPRKQKEYSLYIIEVKSEAAKYRKTEK
jgi:uncharacterized protein YdeI (YjbR/CyaY-like superfamily)